MSGTATVAQVNAIDASTTGVITATISDRSLASLITISGTGNAYTLAVTDSSVNAAALNTLDNKTSVNVNATEAARLTGTAVDIATAISATTIDTASNVIADVSDPTNVINANTIDANTTGVVTATISDTAMTTLSGLTGTGNAYAITISDTSVTAAALNTLDGKTTAAINANAVNAISGTAGEVTTAFNSTGISNLNAGNDTVTVSNTALSSSGSTVLNAGDGTDTLTSTSSAAQNLSLSAANQGTLGDIAFFNLENVTLGTGNDTATIGKDGSILSLHAEAGSDTLNLEATSSTVSLSADGTGTADTTSFSGFEFIHAGDGTDTLNTKTGNNTVSLSADGAGTADGTTFSSFEVINAGNGADTLNTKAGNNSVQLIANGAGIADGTSFSSFEAIHAGDGSDTLKISSGVTSSTNIIGAGSGYIGSNQVSFSGFDNIELGDNNHVVTVDQNGSLSGNLSLGTGNDNIELRGGSIGGDLLLGAGDNRLTLYNDSTISGNITAGSGNDVVTITSGTIEGNIDLGGGSNTLKTVNSKTDGIVINGGSGSDRMIFEGQGALTGTINAGAGNDVISLSSESLPIGSNALLASAVRNLQTTLHDAAVNGNLATAANTALLNASSDVNTFTAIVDSLKDNSFTGLPSISAIPANRMEGALGAYVSSANTIVVNQEWLATANSNDLKAVLVEEFGHFLDYQVNGGTDTPGDEGEAFSRALLQYGASGGYASDADGIVSITLTDGTQAIGEANSSAAVASTLNRPNHLSIDGGDGLDSVELIGFDLSQAADFARTGGFGDFVNYTSAPEGKTLESSYLNMSIKNVEEVSWDKTSQETASVSEVSLTGVQETTATSGADLTIAYGVSTNSAAITSSVADGVSSYSEGHSLGLEDSSFGAGDALRMTISFGGNSNAVAQSVADAADAVAVGYGVGLDQADLTAGSSLTVNMSDVFNVAADASTTTGDGFAVASNDGIGATDLIAIGESAVDAVFTLNLTNTANAITSNGSTEAVGWLGANSLDQSSISSGGIGLINVTVNGMNAVGAESVSGEAIADAFTVVTGVSNTDFDFADTNSAITTTINNDTSAASSSVLSRALSELTSTVSGLVGNAHSGDSIFNTQSVSSIIADRGFADAASVGGIASSIASQTATGISGYAISTTENLLIRSESTMESIASSSVVDA